MAPRCWRGALTALLVPGRERSEAELHRLDEPAADVLTETAAA